LGSLDGVLSTRAAWLGEHEVVEVRFHPIVLSFEALLAAAIERSCDQRVFATSDAQLVTARAKVGERALRFDPTAQKLRDVESTERLYYLGRSPLCYVPLTPKQARQVNTALAARVLGSNVASTNAEPGSFLSPRQRALAGRITTTLERDRARLADLERPDTIRGLADYEARLERALEAGQ
jgi:hypothetical protein